MSTPRPHIAELHIAAEPEAWERAGFIVAGDAVQVGSVLIRLDPSLERSPSGGVSAWRPAGEFHPDPDFDGLPLAGEPDPQPMEPGDGVHPNGVSRIDHVVVLTPDLERTIDAFETRGVRCRRIREVGPPEQQLRQAFFRFSEVIVEVVAVPEGKAGPGGNAIFWGLTFTVTDLEPAVEQLGENLGTPRDAVQEGRTIATVRSGAGLGVPVALITPEPDRAG